MGDNNRLTIIESPYRKGNRKANEVYLKRCILDSLKRGETPFASHGFFTHFFDDSIEQERNNGISIGYRFWDHAITIAFYVDYGISDGMITALQQFTFWQKSEALWMQIRYIGENPSA